MTQPNAKLVEVARAIGDLSETFGQQGALRAMRLPEPMLAAMAGAAIRILMEPSEDMVEAGKSRIYMYVSDYPEDAADTARETLTAMLAQVLEEEG